jgi:hypothetical protein
MTEDEATRLGILISKLPQRPPPMLQYTVEHMPT